MYEAHQAAQLEAELYEDNVRTARYFARVKWMNAEIARLNAVLSETQNTLARVRAANSGDEAQVAEHLIEAISDIVSPDCSLWARMQLNLPVWQSAADKALIGRVNDAVGAYRSCYWPEEFPADALDPWPESREERQNALADIAYDASKEVA